MGNINENKKLKLAFLEKKVLNKNCPNCFRMKACNPVFSITEADLNKKIMFIAEAPGRLGADLSRIPMWGDKSGDNFEELISSINLTREDFYITNSVLCLPLNNEGNNDTPKADEIKNCSYFLNEQIKLINPEIIITLGAKALKALKYIRNHNITLNKDVAALHLWNGYYVFPLYHTSPKVIRIHRDMDRQLEDYKMLKECLDFKILT